MSKRWYRIYELSVRAMLAYAKPEGDGFKIRLGRIAAESCMNRRSPEQEENALFDQLTVMLNGELKPNDGEVITDLEDVIFYADFSGIFDRNSKYCIGLQKKAESLFRPEGVEIDLGGGMHRYLAFERSQNMSRESVLSFIREDVIDSVNERIMLGMKIGRCQLSKLYAYKGLMFSDGVRIEGIGLDADKVIVVDDPKYTVCGTDVITVADKDGGAVRKYERCERKEDIEVLGFDGEGLICPGLAGEIGKQLGREHGTFQIRLPFIKGMLHSVDFHDFFKSADVEYLTDIWGEKHSISEVGVILTKSMVKCFGWLKENSMSWADYWSAYKKYRHALYISAVGNDRIESITELNYQLLNTLAVTAEDFRPLDLPNWFEGKPLDDGRSWLTKETEQEYDSLCSDTDYEVRFFTDRHYGPESSEARLSEILRRNPGFIAEEPFRRVLRNRTEKLIKNFAFGRLTVEGDNRYLSGDLLELLRVIAVSNGAEEGSDFLLSVSSELLDTDSFYSPGAKYNNSEYCTLLRNPHIARNEEVQLKPYPNSDGIRSKYLGHLIGVVMVSAESLAADRMGGADFDGDQVKVISEKIINRSVRRSHQESSYPLLKIPSEKPVERDANDWQARYETVRSTFSSRVGQISNAALNRSVIAYNENSDSPLRERCRLETEMLAILTGLEIDSVKTGVKPDLSEYLGTKDIPRSRFLKYKYMLEKSDEKSSADEREFVRQFERFFEKTDWDKVTSNLERLPLYAYEISSFCKLKTIDFAPDSELFVFAQEPNWKDRLDKDTLEKVGALIDDYDLCMKRIRYCNQPSENKNRPTDVRRILFSRGEDMLYDADEIYAAFTGIAAARITQIRKEIFEKKWQFVRPEDREELLADWLPEMPEYYELFSDFREGGYKLMADVIADLDDDRKQSDNKRFFRPNDSEQFKTMMTAFLNKPGNVYYRDAVGEKCRELLEQIIQLPEAVKYFEALGKRREMLDLLTDETALQVREVK